MSYASGMAIGLTIGQQLLKFFSKDGGNNKIFSFSELHQGLNTINEEIKAQSFRLAHAIKGRRRYYIDALKQNEKLAKVLTQVLILATGRSSRSGLKQCLILSVIGPSIASGNQMCNGNIALLPAPPMRSEERRVGKECRSRWSPYH